MVFYPFEFRPATLFDPDPVLHSRGGASKLDAAECPGCARELQVALRLDLRDPDVWPLQLLVPNEPYFEVLYCFECRPNGPLRYHVFEGAFVLQGSYESAPESNYPYAGYSRAVPEEELVLVPWDIEAFALSLRLSRSLQDLDSSVTPSDFRDFGVAPRNQVFGFPALRQLETRGRLFVASCTDHGPEGYRYTGESSVQMVCFYSFPEKCFEIELECD